MVWVITGVREREDALSTKGGNDEARTRCHERDDIDDEWVRLWAD